MVEMAPFGLLYHGFAFGPLYVNIYIYIYACIPSSIQYAASGPRRRQRWSSAVRAAEADEDEIMAKRLRTPAKRLRAKPRQMRITYDAQTPALTRPPAKRLRTKTTLYRPGLNIQWPFSQLVLLGVKTEEIRSYALNHRDIADANQEYYIVETQGPCKKAMKNAIFGDIDIAPRPNAAHIVGTVIFSQSHQYKDQNTFHQARDKHCIAQGSKNTTGTALVIALDGR